jgi:hypothetical protein
LYSGPAKSDPTLWSGDTDFVSYHATGLTGLACNIAGDLNDVKFNYTHVLLTAVVLALVMVVEAVHTSSKEKEEKSKT